MTAKEKAEQLYNKMYSTTTHPSSVEVRKECAKQCALVAVDEIIEAIDFDWMEVQNLESEHRYWDAVKQEIKNL